MTLEEWQTNEPLVQYATELMHHPNFRELLNMLKDSHIKNYRPVDNMELQPSTHIMHLGRIYGYDECLENIERAAQLRKEFNLTSTFEPPEQRQS